MITRYDLSWDPLFKAQFEQPYMKQLEAFLEQERATELIFPSEADVFHAFELTPLDQVKVVILGQDPYHNHGQAHGLSFSVPKGIPLPPSLKNIFKELATDMEGFSIPVSGDLTAWAVQGVLLLNATLTVRAHAASSHQKKGWETFTDYLIQQISASCPHVVFILWGSYAQKKAAFIDTKKHLILQSAHPSPLSAYRGFFGSAPFSRANEFLVQAGLPAIDWRLSI